MKKLATFAATAAFAIGVGLSGTALAANASKELTASNNGGMDVGMVVVNDNGGSITVTYTTNGTWLITETHTHLDPQDSEGDCLGWPMTGSGNPKVGKFDMQTDWPLPGSDMVVVTFADTFGDDSTVCVAAHAVVYVYDSSAPGDAEEQFDATNEGAWGDGDGTGHQFPGHNWAAYFTFETDSPPL